MPLGLPAPQDRQDPQGLTVRLDLPAPQDPRDPPGLTVPLGLPAPLVLPAKMALPAPPGLRVLTVFKSLRCIGFRQARPAQHFVSEAPLWE